MTEQSTHDSFNLSPLLQAKLRAFAEGLTPEESEQLHTLPTEDVTGMLSPSLREKAQRVAQGLSAEEQAQLSLLLERVGVGEATSEEVDTRGYMKRLSVELDLPPDQVGGSFGLPFGAVSWESAAGAVLFGVILLNPGPTSSQSY